jgi:putative flippase GtrA
VRVNARLAALRSTTRGQLLLSVASSLLSFALDFGVLALLTEVAGLYYLVSAGISFVAGTTLSYALSVAFIFALRRHASAWIEYALFVLVGVVGLGLNEVLLWVGADVLGVHYLISKIIAASLVFFWNFTARKLLLFSGAREGKHS